MEPDSAAEGVDTAVGEATQFAKTGSATKTKGKSGDPKVYLATLLWLISIRVCRLEHDIGGVLE